jgi:hypothetical protein
MIEPTKIALKSVKGKPRPAMIAVSLSRAVAIT